MNWQCVGVWTETQTTVMPYLLFGVFGQLRTKVCVRATNSATRNDHPCAATSRSHIHTYYIERKTYLWRANEILRHDWIFSSASCVESRRLPNCKGPSQRDNTSVLCKCVCVCVCWCMERWKSKQRTQNTRQPWCSKAFAYIDIVLFSWHKRIVEIIVALLVLRLVEPVKKTHMLHVRNTHAFIHTKQCVIC